MARILLIDDVDVVRLVIRKMLARSGHEVEEASDGIAGIERLQSGGFDLVITDIWMPALDGVTFLRKARELSPGLPIIAISGGAPRSSATQTLEEAAAMGANAVLMKPVDREELEQALAAALPKQSL